MKKKPQNSFRKVRSKMNADEYFTSPNWPIKEIEGVKYLTVVKHQPVPGINQQQHFLRQDAVEYVK